MTPIARGIIKSGTRGSRMIFRTVSLEPGLYLVATPIGNARDITLRALYTLASADLILAEDTRTARKLMEIHGVELRGRPLRAYHDHSGPADRARIMAALEAGQSVAYVSEAGTPLVADPGFKLVVDAVEAGHPVHPVPGASAVLAALSVGGLGTDRFHFTGFLPTARTARRTALQEMAGIDGTLVMFESGRRIRELLDDLCEMFGTGRHAALCRELTKTFEQVERGTLGVLRDRGDDLETRGEFVVLVGRADRMTQKEEDIDMALRQALRTMRVKDAATTVAGAMGLNRREVYQRALALGRMDDPVKDGGDI